MVGALLFALQAMPFVHVETEVGTHVLVERVDDHGNAAPACMAPCDQPLDANASYRLRSDAYRTTNLFRLRSSDPERRIDVHVVERKNSSLVTAIVLMSLSGAFATAGAFVAGAGGVGWMDHGVAIGVAIPLFTLHLATGIPAVLLFASSLESRATAIEGDRIALSRAQATARAPFVVPLLVRSF